MKPGVRVPLFTEKLFRQTVKEGEPALFTCRVVGLPEPDVKWYKDGQVKFPIFTIFIPDDLIKK